MQSIDAVYSVFTDMLKKMETTKMGTTIKMDAISTVILSVPVIHLKNAKGLDIPGFMKEIEKNVEHYNSRWVPFNLWSTQSNWYWKDKEAEDWLKRELSTSDDPHAILTDENQIPHILDYDDIIEAIQNAAYNEEIFDRSDMLWPDDSLIKDINKEIASWTGAYPIIKEISGEPFWDRYWKTRPNEQ